jgi:hypothetical protein
MCISLLSAAAITKYAPVKIASQSDGEGATSAGATDICVGLAQHAASAAGESVNIAFLGVSKAVASAAITKGALVQPTGSAGKVKTAVSTGYALGIALEAAAADGDEIPILLGPQSHLLA